MSCGIGEISHSEN